SGIARRYRRDAAIRGRVRSCRTDNPRPPGRSVSHRLSCRTTRLRTASSQGRGVRPEGIEGLQHQVRVSEGEGLEGYTDPAERSVHGGAEGWEIEDGGLKMEDGGERRLRGWCLEMAPVFERR